MSAIYSQISRHVITSHRGSLRYFIGSVVLAEIRALPKNISEVPGFTALS
jgi:hypothetical protein